MYQEKKQCATGGYMQSSAADLHKVNLSHIASIATVALYPHPVRVGDPAG